MNFNIDVNINPGHDPSLRLGSDTVLRINMTIRIQYILSSPHVHYIDLNYNVVFIYILQKYREDYVAPLMGPVNSIEFILTIVFSER